MKKTILSIIWFLLLFINFILSFFCFAYTLFIIDNRPFSFSQIIWSGALIWLVSGTDRNRLFVFCNNLLSRRERKQSFDRYKYFAPCSVIFYFWYVCSFFCIVHFTLPIRRCFYCIHLCIMRKIHFLKKKLPIFLMTMIFGY